MLFAEVGLLIEFALTKTVFMSHGWNSYLFLNWYI